MMWMISGSVNNYVRQLGLQKKTEEKLHNFAQYESEKERLKAMALAQKPDPVKTQTDAILYKLKSGRTLTATDLDHLRKYAPQSYAKAVEALAERKQYERELAACKTKEEVAQVQQQRIQNLASRASAIQKSGMDRSSKIAAMEWVGVGVAQSNDAHQNFVNTAQYASLPDKERDDDDKKDEKKKKPLEKSEEMQLYQSDAQLKMKASELLRKSGQTKEADEATAAASSRKTGKEEQAAPSVEVFSSNAQTATAEAPAAPAETAASAAPSSPAVSAPLAPTYSPSGSAAPVSEKPTFSIKV